MKKNKLVGKIIDWSLNVLIVIFAILLLISMYTTFQIKILKNEYSNFFGYSLFEVQTGSMHKAIEAGDWIIIKGTKDIEIGDIVTYKHNKDYITHRVIESYKGTYVTKGDANNAKDDPIDQSQIVGKVVKILPGFGLMRKTIFNPVVVIMLIITLYLFNLTFNPTKSDFDKKMKMILDKIIKIIKEKNSKNKKTSKPLIKEKRKEVIETKELIEEQKKEEIKEEPIEEPIEKEVLKDESEIFANIKNSDKIDKEEELSKTAIYRVVSVKDKKEEKKNTDEVEVLDFEKDLEKTSMFRIISVNKEPEPIETKKEETKEETIIIEEEKPKQKNNVEIVNLKLTAEKLKPEKIVEQKPLKEKIEERIKNKKSKNIVEKTLFIRKIIYDEVLNVLLNEEKAYVKKSNLRNEFLEEYMVEKYYNNEENNLSKIEKKLLDYSETLNYKYIRDEKQLNIIKAYTKAFTLIAEVDDKIETNILETKLKKIMGFENEQVEEKKEEIRKIYEYANEYLNSILEKLDTSTFEVKYSKVIKDMYGALLNHNISFSRVYSDYIVEKTYSEGIVSEDKIKVLLNLIMCKITKDIMKSDYTTKYIIYIPKALYEKDKKLDKILSTIDNEYAKNHIVILTTATSILKNKDDIMRIKKRGYSFAVVYNKKMELDSEDLGYLYMADYHFIDTKENMEICEAMPKEIINKIIKENISNKIGDFRSE